MCTFYEMNGQGPCYAAASEDMDIRRSNYIMDVNYWMRPGVSQCQDNSLGSTCSFYGPMTVPRTTRESFLQGRGQVESDKCPDCEVIHLPESVFRENVPKSSCQNMALEPEYTRAPKSCSTISETNMTQYAFMPGAFQMGYTGMDSMCGTMIHDRENARMQSNSAAQSGTNAHNPNVSYGSYY